MPFDFQRQHRFFVLFAMFELAIKHRKIDRCLGNRCILLCSGEFAEAIATLANARIDRYAGTKSRKDHSKNSCPFELLADGREPTGEL